MSAPVNEAAHGAVHGPEHGARVSRRPANKGQGEAFLVVDDLSVQFPTEDGLLDGDHGPARPEADDHHRVDHPRR